MGGGIFVSLAHTVMTDPLRANTLRLLEDSGVVEIRKGRRMLSFPGPGSCNIDSSPGARHFELVKAPSGHLLIPCDEFQRICAPQPAVVSPERVLPAVPVRPQSSPVSLPASSSSEVLAHVQGGAPEAGGPALSS